MSAVLHPTDGDPPDPYADFAAGRDDDPPVTVIAEGAEWDENAIPPRPWIVPGYLMRGAVTVLSGPGSAGKSMLAVLWCCALASGEKIGHFAPRHPATVLTYNVEDDHDEQRRRFSATLRQLRQPISALADRVTRLWPAGIGTLFARDTMTGTLRPTDAMAAIEEHIAERRPDVLILDPLVELHDAEENDNTALRAVMAKLRGIAAEHNCAVLVLHHGRKGIAGSPGDPDSLRGASSIVGAARVVLTVLTMDETEAERLGIAKTERRSYFRLDGAKSNYAPIDEAEWFERVEHQLANGDRVAAAWPWQPPSPFRDLTTADVNAALDRIAAGPAPGILYAPTQRGNATHWAGNVLMEDYAMPEGQARAVIGAWLKSGLLVVQSAYDAAQRKERKGVTVDNSRRPT